MVASCPQCCEAIYSSVSGLKAHLASCSKVSFQALFQGDGVLGTPSQPLEVPPPCECDPAPTGQPPLPPSGAQGLASA